jgi:hypothetical protein
LQAKARGADAVNLRQMSGGAFVQN